MNQYITYNPETGNYSFISTTEPERHNIVATYVGTLPTGEWSDWAPHGDVLRRFQGALHIYKSIKEFPLLNGRRHNIQGPERVVQEGEYLIVLSEYYYREYKGCPMDADICTYCGRNNTDSEGNSLRMEFDCYYCGSN